MRGDAGRCRETAGWEIPGTRDRVGRYLVLAPARVRVRVRVRDRVTVRVRVMVSWVRVRVRETAGWGDTWYRASGPRRASVSSDGEASCGGVVRLGRA